MRRTMEDMVTREVRRSEAARRRDVEQGLPCERSVITISRPMGTGARVVAQKLADDLGWSLWGHELIDAVAEDAHVSKRVVETFDEHAVSEIDTLTRYILGDHQTGDFVYVKHLVRAVMAIAQLGNAIILGRGAYLILPHALNVMINASFEQRVSNMMTYEHLSRRDAEDKLRTADKEQMEFLIRTYGRERVENTHHDVTIFTDSIDTDGAVEIIKTAINVWRECVV